MTYEDITARLLLLGFKCFNPKKPREWWSITFRNNYTHLSLHVNNTRPWEPAVYVRGGLRQFNNLEDAWDLLKTEVHHIKNLGELR